MKHPLRLGVGVAAVLCVVALAAIVETRSPPAPPLRVALNLWPGYDMLYLAEVEGFFADAGVAVKLHHFSSLGDARRAFESGRIDVLPTTPVELLIARELSRVDARAFFVCDYSNGADVLIADSGIESIEQLRGKKVGAEPGTVDVLMVALALESVGMTLADVEIVPLSQIDSEIALENREVAAIESYPPRAEQILESGLGHRVFDSSRVPEQVVDVFIARSELIEQRGADLHRIILAYDDARRLRLTEPERTATVLARRAGVSVAAYERGFAGVKLVPFDDQTEFLVANGKLTTMLRKIAKTLHANGVLRELPDVEGIPSLDPLRCKPSP